MGKKSKKKGKAGDNTKASRKERLQERREQQLDALDRDSDEDYDDDEANENETPPPLQREYFVGDRVWFVKNANWDGCNPNSYRGIVQCVHANSVDILSLQSMIDGDSTTLINIPLGDYVYPDFCDLTLRFNVGERVLCKCDVGWLPMNVAYLWPIGEVNVPPQRANDVVPRYKCNDPTSRHQPVAVPEDNDLCIMKHPSIYTCELDDRVIFNARLAKATTKVAIQYLNKSSWIEGTVTARDITGLESFYISYACSFDIAGKQYLCHITKDDDEHIANINASPRKRLFDAIEQDCSRTHLIYLTTTYSIDVFTFRDLVIAKALDCASYQTLSWLQFDCKIDVLHYKDDGGNNILHKIASSSNAARLIRAAGNFRNMEPHPEWYLNIFIYEVIENPNRLGRNKLLHMINAPNNNNESWLQILVRRGDVHAFDTALSPNGGLGLEFAAPYRFYDEEINSLAKTVKESNDVIMQVVLDSFIMFRTLYLQCSDICHTYSEEELQQSESMVVFQGTEARHHAKLLSRFLLDWEGNADLKVRQGLVRNSFSKLFSLLCDVNDGLFHLFMNDTYICVSNKDQNEYIQPELSPVIVVGEFSCERLEVDLATACVIGKDGKYSDCDRDSNYFSQLKQHALSSGDDGSSWLSYLKSITERSHSYTHRSMDFLKNKIKLLEDDVDLLRRLQILEYILTRQPTIKLNVLEAIEHRQCGVLRFMVDKNLIQIESNASSNQFFKKSASKLKFLDRGRIPSDLKSKCFLCFAAVEYDDLQSLQWISESFGIPTELCDGLNLLHFSAFMGRIEIVAWLYTQHAVWQSLVVQTCQRKPFQGAFAVHIAAMQGHILLVEILLGMKVSQEDDKGNTPESYAKKSQHTFAQEWALEKEKQQEKPRARERIIQKLLRLTKLPQTTSESLKTFIITSKCLDKETWNDCEYYERGPMGYSCGDILHECCSTFPDESFALWLCTRLFFLDNEYYGFWGNNLAIQTQPLTRDYLFSVAKDKGYNDIVRYLSKQLFDDIRCVDPMTYNYVLVSALGVGDRLLETRASILRILILLQIADKTNDEFQNLVKRGGSSTDVDEILRISCKVKKCLVDEGYAQEGYNHRGSKISYVVKLIDMTTIVYQDYNQDEHSLFKQLAFMMRSGGEVYHVHIILATEGFAELLEYCLRNLQGWTVDMELDVVRIAAFYGHSSILELFLNGEGLLSTVNCRIRAAVFGLGEAGRSRDMIQLLDSYGDQYAFVKEERLSTIRDSDMLNIDDFEANVNSRQAYADKSLACAVINGYIRFLSDRDMTTLLILVDRFDYTHDDIINAAVTFLSTAVFCVEMMGRFIDLLPSAFESLNLEPILHHKQIQGLCTEIVIFFEGRMWRSSEDETEESLTVQSKTLQWLGQMADQGIDIQKLTPDSHYRRTLGQTGFIPKYLELEKRQLHMWSQFDIIVNGGSLQEIQDAVEQGRLSIHARYRGGLMLTHLSSAYDRDDLLQWLIVTKGMKLDSHDGQRRNVLEVAMAAQATSTIKWIIEHKAGRMIARFMRQHQRHILAVRKQQRLARAATFIQRRYRGNSIRKIYRGSLLLRLEESPRFKVVWGALAYSIHDFSQNTSGWSSIRERISDIVRIHDDDGNFDDTDEHLSKALEEAMLMDESDKNKSDGEVFVNTRQQSLDIIEGPTADTASWLSFQMTSHVVKFLKQGDPKYKAFFVRRMEQLGLGERSRILQKRLKGSQSTIFETYLEMKSGFRILWTQEGTSIVVWFVAKHKDVSRLMRMIDDCKSRTARQQISQSLISDLQNENLVHQVTTQNNGVLLDVFGNVPLKLYEVKFHSISDIANDSWTPKLYLTDEERDVVEAEGTVLVLGRSGTGKTVCICNRIEYDRQRYGQDPTFSQLFVARSKRLCKYVSETAGKYERGYFQTFDEMIYAIHAAIPHREGGKDIYFLPSQRVDFQRFRLAFHDHYAASSSSNEISALISFGHSSRDQLRHSNGILPRDSFTVVDVLGKNRCRVPAHHREHVYNEFEAYQTYIKEKGLWDECDRVRHLLHKFNDCNKVDSSALDRVRRSRVYVDEIQDYTQIECLVFFYLGGPSGLFLAGDSAQSVVEGTEFRFEEIRSIGYFVAGSDRHELVPQKPKTVNVNFRSHAGILNTAAAFLDVLFKYFPGSAKQLKKDRGLFQGSRPGMLYNVDIKQLGLLLSDKLNGTVVLVHDESSHYWRKALGDYKLVYGIREAKGLEFKSVMVLNFFHEIPLSLQKPWRNLLLNREGLDFEFKYPLVGTQLKLLYTGITRCIERLFFVETSASLAGDAVVRWLTTTSLKKAGDSTNEVLATRNNITNVESMSMTADEFLGEGFNNAEMAESAELELEQAHNALDRSIWCFEQAGSHELAAKARTHRQSIQFRLDLVRQQQLGTDDSTAQLVIEMKGSQMMESLKAEGLLLELLNLFYSMKPFMSVFVSEELERCYISKIRLATTSSQ